MTVIGVGSSAPPVEGVDVGIGALALWFYKVTCPVCQMTGPVARRLSDAYPGSVCGVGQDAEEDLDAFAAECGAELPRVSDGHPYAASTAYGIEVVPTLVVLRDGQVFDVVESWDRDGYNRASHALADLTGREFVAVSDERDGLPVFRPG